MTLKTMLDNVMLESGMDTEVAYATSSKDEVLRLISLANRSARRIATGYDWQALRKTYTFTMTSDTTYDLPDDFRALISDTAFADNYIDTVDMRTNPTVWRFLQVNSSGSGPRFRARIMDNKIEIYAPQSGENISFEYTSDYPVKNSVGTAQKSFSADSDTWILDDDLLEMDLIWRYKKLLGLPDWQIDAAEFKSYEKTTKGQQAGAKTIIGGESFGDDPYTPLWINS